MKFNFLMLINNQGALDKYLNNFYHMNFFVQGAGEYRTDEATQ
jgi:hypothetical protein